MLIKTWFYVNKLIVFAFTLISHLCNYTKANRYDDTIWNLYLT